MLLKTAVFLLLTGAASAADAEDGSPPDNKANVRGVQQQQEGGANRELSSWDSSAGAPHGVSCPDGWSWDKSSNPCYWNPGKYFPSSISPKHFVQCGAHGECHDGKHQMCMQGDGALGANVWCPSINGCQHACLCKEYKHDHWLCPKKKKHPHHHHDKPPVWDEPDGWDHPPVWDKPPAWDEPGHWEPPAKQCDEPKPPFSVLTREECCPCCDEETCKSLAGWYIIPFFTDIEELTSSEISELVESYSTFVDYALKKIKQCATTYSRFEYEAFLQEEFGVGTREVEEEEVEASAIDGLYLLADLLGDEGYAVKNFLYGVLYDRSICGYDKEDSGKLLDSGDLYDEGIEPVSFLDCCFDRFFDDGSPDRRRKLGENVKKFFSSEKVKKHLSSRLHLSRLHKN